MEQILAIQHGPYSLKAGKRGPRVEARAFLTGATTGRGIVASTEGATPQAALDALVLLLDTRNAARRAARRIAADGTTDVPTAEEFAEALAAAPVTDGQRAMLRAHRAAGPDGLTTGQLADAAGYAALTSANLHYGKLGKMVAAHLGLPVADARRDGFDAATFILAEAGPRRADGNWVWVMHAELAEALGAGA